MDESKGKPFLSEGKLLLLKTIAFIAVAYALKRLLEGWACAQLAPCPLDANQLPLILAGLKQGGLLVPALFVAFALPTGYFAVAATIIGLEAGLAAGLDWLQLTLLYALASIASVCLTYFTVKKVYFKSKKNKVVEFWFSKFKAFEHYSKKLLGKTGLFAGLAIANAFSSLIYTSLLAVLLEVPVPQALAALLTGNIISFLLAALVVIGASALTNDLILATLTAITISVLAAYLVNKRAENNG